MHVGRAVLLALLQLALLPAIKGQTPSAEHLRFFENQIRPLLVARCQGCHNAKLRTAGLDLTDAAGASQVESSRLLKAVSYQDRIKMPPAGKLKDDEIAALREWVKIGAPWPKSAGGSAAGPEFWSFRPIQRIAPLTARVGSPIDSFILDRLAAQGLRPAPPADKVTLIRRATLDLTGLPPTEEEIRAFLSDTSPAAYEKLVDRLLASPRYGERWGRYWLDVARYADSTGADEDHRYPYAWRYRDYVIDAFNHDLPYDRFIQEQIAGDLLPAPDNAQVNMAGIVATGFLALGPKLIAEQDKVKMFYDIVDEQIDVTGKAFLGLTLACARCHDHKFDPISTRDYYSLASIFASTKQLAKLEGTVSELYYAPLVSKDIAGRYEAHQKRIADKQREIVELTNDEARRYRDARAPRISEYMLAGQSVYADGAPPSAVAKERSIDQAELESWVKYLQPGKERRAQLERWYNASPSELKSVADSYQQEFLALAAKRNQAIDEWKEKAAAARAIHQDPPEAPVFQAGENRFFTDVTTAEGPFTLPKKNKEEAFSEPGRARAKLLQAELKQLKDSSPPEPPLACGVAEGQRVDQHVFLRGNPESLGEATPKQFPVVLAGKTQPSITEGSGRRELAAWLSDPRNPLPARVMVNRIWQGHFGDGIVRTASNFGVTGERPTHPELLDWLAAEFIAKGWSVKAMHKLIMLSNTYQMSGQTTAEKNEKDPDNRLFSRFKMRRMTVEELRDSLLSLDGAIDLTMGGALQTGVGRDKEFSEDRKGLNPDESRRRTVYLPLRRSNLPSLLVLFDFGDGTTSNETRSQTNVAPQALFVMNSAFVAERARSLAQKLLRNDGSDARRIERAWMAVLGREPEPEETRSALEYVGRFPSKAAGDEGRLEAWSSLCRSLVASNDFIYVH